MLSLAFTHPVHIPRLACLPFLILTLSKAPCLGHITHHCAGRRPFYPDPDTQPLATRIILVLALPMFVLVLAEYHVSLHLGY